MYLFFDLFLIFCSSPSSGSKSICKVWYQSINYTPLLQDLCSKKVLSTMDRTSG